MRIEQLSLKTSDIKGAGKFYGDLLNLPVINGTRSKISFQVGSSILSFSKASHKCFYHFAFNIAPHLFDDAFKWIRKRARILPFSASSPIADYPGWRAKAFYFYDHEGNIAECIARFDLPNPPPAVRKIIPSFISISEIGIVVKEVEPVLHQMKQVYEIPLFKKGPQLPDFTPMGDDEGLLLITQNSRGWSPTQRPAEQHDAEVCFIQNKKVRNLKVESGKILIPKNNIFI
ncbi:VOC family protein [Salinimicrobium sp. TH3]|uniref:VOC family protein n=1 Tax=Salinimicrobium sp. TH3 TaxID=2997342 RepID=UPI00227473DC|nr:hypothetical protein [Salinimicrobium sp. TH3]MCY2685943.1 hypothetical protein [Salinimicrobium sp. TH3]